MVNQRKYVSNRRSYAYIRRTSDRLCKEHGLSVLVPGQDRGKSYAEWDAHRKGMSWKAKLKAAIDAAIPQAKDFDDFLRLLQEQGYEIIAPCFLDFNDIHCFMRENGIGFFFSAATSSAPLCAGTPCSSCR